MMRSFVPRKLQPWIYLCIAFAFQLSGGIYIGAVNEMIGEHSLMREDLLMCLYSTLAGMAIYFPLLFRMKFRFTNKTLLTAAAVGALVCNLVAPHITFLPLLWAVCFIEGICKIQGTFECMSNVQLWITPKRDFTVFFPVLNIFILGCVQLSDFITTYLMYHYHWIYMHFFISLLMLGVIFFQTTCVRHVQMMKKFPLFGIDWLGAALWAALLLEVAYLFDYGEYLDWWNSSTVWQLTVVIIVNTVFCLWRMNTIRHPYFEPKMWTYPHYWQLLGLVTLMEAIIGTERVLEEMFYENIMHYEATVSARLDWLAWGGIVVGCTFSYWWMHVRRYNFLRLISVGFAFLALYLVGYYFILSPTIHISQLYPVIFSRGFAYAVLSVTFMVCLEELMTFQHFFQGLSVFNMLHMIVGGVVGGAIYSRMLAHFMPENIARYGQSIDSVAFSRSPFDLGSYMDEFIEQVMEVSIKQVYGWVAYICIAVLLVFLIADTPARHPMKIIPRWKSVAADIKHSYWRWRKKTL